MDLPPEAIIGGFSALCIAVTALWGRNESQHRQRHEECKAGREECEARSRDQQDQIDALIDGDADKARRKRDTDTVPVQPPTPPKKKRRWMSRALAVLALFGMGGCASTTTGVRSVHHVERRQVHVVVPATTEAPAQVLPVTETVESWDDEQTHIEGKTAPDVQAIAPVAAAVGGAIANATTGGWGTLLEAGLGLLVPTVLGAVAGHKSRDGAVEQLKQQVAFHKDDAEQAYTKLDQGKSA